MPIIATNARVEVENTVGTATAITAITNADPGVVTSAAHGLTNGDVVKIVASDGMVELNNQVVRVANVTTDTFELEGIDTTNYGTYSSSGTNTWQEVTAWLTLAAATSVNLGDAAPSELDGTRLIDRKAVTLYGLPGSVSGSIDIQHEPHTAAVQKFKAADTSDLLAIRVTWNNGNIAVFGAKTAYSGGFSASVNNILTGAIPVTVPAEIAEYAS